MKEHYQGNPFTTWKNVLKAKEYKHKNYTSIDAKKHILSLVPFVRNLIEYGIDKEVNTFIGINKDYILLTNLLHFKNDTINIKFKQLKTIYIEYIGEDDFDNSIDIENDSIYDSILEIAENIDDDNIQLENKIILAIAIRLKSEEFMKNEIDISSFTYTWQTGFGRNRRTETGNQNVFLAFIDTCNNQTWELFNGYCQMGDNDIIKILDSVNIMTPENIHLNSFMYEPLLDMDIIELKSLYDNVKSL